MRLRGSSPNQSPGIRVEGYTAAGIATETYTPKSTQPPVHHVEEEVMYRVDVMKIDSKVTKNTHVQEDDATCTPCQRGHAT